MSRFAFGRYSQPYSLGGSNAASGNQSTVATCFIYYYTHHYSPPLISPVEKKFKCILLTQMFSLSSLVQSANSAYPSHLQKMTNTNSRNLCCIFRPAKRESCRNSMQVYSLGASVELPAKPGSWLETENDFSRNWRRDKLARRVSPTKSSAASAGCAAAKCQLSPRGNKGSNEGTSLLWTRELKTS